MTATWLNNSYCDSIEDTDHDQNREVSHGAETSLKGERNNQETADSTANKPPFYRKWIALINKFA